MVTTILLVISPLIVGWLADLCFGDPERLPHPVVGFGRLIASGERRLNHGSNRRRNGAILAIALIVATFVATALVDAVLSRWLLPVLLFRAVVVFYCLAGTTLVREVREVFRACDRSLADGRRQVARIVGRDTSQLSVQEVRTAALETLAENLSDGVVAPLFWLVMLGVPGMMAYKMVNTLDSMIGYRTERYAQFGTVAARIDDAANWIPARLTALLMVAAAGLSRWGSLWRFVRRYGPQHASPNSGWPEAALAGYLDCRFGGTHSYFGESVPKPYIGSNPRPVTTADMQRSVALCRRAEMLMIFLTAAAFILPLLLKN